MKIKYIIYALAVGQLSGFAASPDYDTVISQVLDRGYGIKSDSLRMAAQVADVLAENVPEGPEAEFEHLWPAAGDTDNRWSAGISQSIDWPGAYTARRRHADAMSDASREVLRGVVLDKALAAKLLVIDIINARQRLEFFEEVTRNVARIDSLTRRAYNLEAATVLDLRKTRLALLDSQREQAAVRADIEALEASLTAIGSIAATNNWTEYPNQALHSDYIDPETLPEYRVAAAQTREAQARLSAVRSQAWPGFSIGFRHAYEEGTHFNGLTIGIRLPSWSRKKRTEAARLEAEALAGDHAATLAGVFAGYEALNTTARQIGDELALYREFSGDDSYLPLLQKAFDGGELTVIDFLNEINIFRAARLNYLDLDYRYQLTLARLNRYRSPFFN